MVRSEGKRKGKRDRKTEKEGRAGKNKQTNNTGRWEDEVTRTIWKMK